MCIGKFSGRSPDNRIRQHNGKLPLGFSQHKRHFRTDDPDLAETFLRNHTPRDVVKVTGQTKYRDWFFVHQEVLDAALNTWPKSIEYKELTLVCQGWTFNELALIEQQAMFSYL